LRPTLAKDSYVRQVVMAVAYALGQLQGTKLFHVVTSDFPRHIISFKRLEFTMTLQAPYWFSVLRIMIVNGKIQHQGNRHWPRGEPSVYRNCGLRPLQPRTISASRPLKVSSLSVAPTLEGEWLRYATYVILSRSRSKAILLILKTIVEGGVTSFVW
jgi:hypothetical protein